MSMKYPDTELQDATAASIEDLQGQINEAVRLLTDLWQYDNLHQPVEGVLYSSGTHAEVKARVSDFLCRQSAKQS